ncbi:hypothetical protein FRAAL1496 [Frankia alni ACN14a]|uniref:Uncharacterized protein n=1 Tax=Frankia alni (strain DSM 45986 / CECT 9034 / ACN14a) TaxID=326424 RepID=Q0RQM2_FRAAA|nr:hypothetical protein FRAAL1496 [Frankia alni ACN14a]
MASRGHRTTPLGAGFNGVRIAKLARFRVGRPRYPFPGIHPENASLPGVPRPGRPGPDAPKRHAGPLCRLD